MEKPQDFELPLESSICTHNVLILVIVTEKAHHDWIPWNTFNNPVA
jgi:hypothetical protein